MTNAQRQARYRAVKARKQAELDLNAAVLSLTRAAVGVAARAINPSVQPAGFVEQNWPRDNAAKIIARNVISTLTSASSGAPRPLTDHRAGRSHDLDFGYDHRHALPSRGVSDV
jgi:hypothetical protein